MDGSMISMTELLKRSFEEMALQGHTDLREGDFVNEDGLVCCGVCRKPRETRKLMFGNEMLLPCLCECGEKARDEQEERERLARERQTVTELMSYSLIDERFLQSRFESFTETEENAKALRIAKNYVEHWDEMYASNTGLLLYGPPGTGKSFLAGCIGNELMDRGVPVMATSIVRLTGSVYSDELQTILRKMQSARLLILDDLGAERDTEFKAEQLFDVIDSRYNGKRPMIVTTNIMDFKSETDIRRRRVYDRIIECCHPVVMKWESWRRQTAKEKYSRMSAMLEG